jgi:uncharacterized membrane protein YdjX (TVP38/TMEM64 family)
MMEKNVAISDNTDTHTESKPKFFKFVLLILIGFTFGFYFTRKGFHLTPESFKNYVLSLGIAGPILYIAIFIIRPLFLIPSIALFIGGGLAFGPILGPTFASLGAALGGTVGFWFSRKMGHEYAIKKLKLGAGVIDNTKFSFSVVFLLSLIPIMPVTVINYGAGLSTMRFNTYISAHILGMIPRAFAFGYFGNTLLEVGSKKFMAALLILGLMGIMTAFYRLRTKQKKRLQLAEEVSASN